MYQQQIIGQNAPMAFNPLLNPIEQARTTGQVIEYQFMAIKPKKKEKELIRTLNDLGDIQNSLNDLLLQQDQKLDSIEENLTLTEERVKLALDDLAECDKLYFSYKPIVVGTLLGGAVFSPLVTLTGVKYLGVSTGVGSLLGGLVGYKIQK